MPKVLFFPVVIALVLAIAGVIFLCFPPKKINIYYGYRTRRAFRDQASWDFAQRYSAKLIILLSSCSAILCGAFYYLVHHHGMKVESNVLLWIYYALPALGALLMILLTELALSRMAK